MVTTFTATSKLILTKVLSKLCISMHFCVFFAFFVKECTSKQYGFECNQTCGICSNGKECHHVDGRCLNGCDVGVFGDKCDQGKMFK